MSHFNVTLKLQLKMICFTILTVIYKHIAKHVVHDYYGKTLC